MRSIPDGLHHHRQGNVDGSDSPVSVQLRSWDGTAERFDPILPFEMLPGAGTVLRGMFEGQMMLNEQCNQLIHGQTTHNENEERHEQRSGQGLIVYDVMLLCHDWGCDLVVEISLDLTKICKKKRGFGLVIGDGDGLEDTQKILSR